MIQPDRVSAVLPTRGDCELDLILADLDSAGITDTIVWDNSQHEDMGIYGRYAAIRKAKNSVIVTQDDDVLVGCWDKILDAYQPGVLTTNYPEASDIPWVSHGAIFDCELPGFAFEQYLARYPYDRYFTHQICDIVFGLLSENVNVVNYGATNLEHAFHPGRVHTTPGWYEHDRPEALCRCAELKTGVIA